MFCFHCGTELVETEGTSFCPKTNMVLSVALNRELRMAGSVNRFVSKVESRRDPSCELY